MVVDFASTHEYVAWLSRGLADVADVDLLLPKKMGALKMVQDTLWEVVDRIMLEEVVDEIMAGKWWISNSRFRTRLS